MSIVSGSRPAYRSGGATGKRIDKIRFTSLKIILSRQQRGDPYRIIHILIEECRGCPKDGDDPSKINKGDDGILPFARLAALVYGQHKYASFKRQRSFYSVRDFQVISNFGWTVARLFGIRLPGRPTRLLLCRSDSKNPVGGRIQSRDFKNRQINKAERDAYSYGHGMINFLVSG